MRHLLIGILLSYRKYRRHVSFHGQVSQLAIVGIEQSSPAFYRNNSRKNLHDEYPNLNSRLNQSQSQSPESNIDFFMFRYRLIYHDSHMITVKEWLDKRLNSQRNKKK